MTPMPSPVTITARDPQPWEATDGATEVLDIAVPTETGDTCIVGLRLNPRHRIVTFDVADELLLNAHPTAIHAILGVALHAARDHLTR